jgi:hypothetical protein
MHLDWKNGANDSVGELTIHVESSLASTTDTDQILKTSTEQPLPGLAAATGFVGTASAIVTEIAVPSDTWQPLLSRLNALVAVADVVAEVRLTYLRCLMTTEKHLPVDSPLDQTSMGNCISSV